METREVLTLQCGHYANHVGAHYWNAQEALFYAPKGADGESEFNHDVLFRYGQTLHGHDTYTPRLLLFDLKGSLGTLREEGTLYTVPAAGGGACWDGNVDEHAAPVLKKNEFLRDLEEDDEAFMSTLDIATDKKSAPGATAAAATAEGKRYRLEGQVAVWSDFLRPHLHPKTTNVIRQYLHGGDVLPFNAHPLGGALFQHDTIADVFEDRLHFFAEECDRPQGFQVFCDAHDGFGGFAASTAAHLAEEYKGRGVAAFLTVPVTAADAKPRDIDRALVNTCASLVGILEHATLASVVSVDPSPWSHTRGPSRRLSHLGKLDLNLPYHSSAVLAAAIDSATVSYRLRAAPATMSSMSATLESDLGLRLTSLRSAFPLGLSDTSSLQEWLGRSRMWYMDDVVAAPLTPHAVCQIPYAQVVTIRGVPTPSVFRIRNERDASRSKLPVDYATTPSELLVAYLQGGHVSFARTIARVAQCGFSTRTPFPSLFSDDISQNGLVTGESDRTPRGDAERTVETVPSLSGFVTGPALHGLLETLKEGLSKVNVREHFELMDAGYSVDDHAEVVEAITTWEEKYSPHADFD